MHWRKVGWVLFAFIIVLPFVFSSIGPRPVGFSLSNEGVAAEPITATVYSRGEASKVSPFGGQKSEVPKASESAQSDRWQKSPGTLLAQAQRSISDKDGARAFELANLVWECSMMPGYMSALNEAPASPNPSIAARMKERRLAVQREFSSCQTLGGNESDLRQLRLQLLDTAVEARVVGAAATSFMLGVRSPAVLHGVVIDAKAGNLESIQWVSSYDFQTVSIARDEHQSIRYALYLASSDKKAGVEATFRAKLADTVANANGLERFDPSKGAKLRVD
jgi:hypothetical protein